MSSCSFLRCDVVYIGSSNAETAFRCWAAAGTLAAFFDRAKVFGVNGVAEVEDAAGCDGVAKALRP
jgi:hypothetical protein